MSLSGLFGRRRLVQARQPNSGLPSCERDLPLDAFSHRHDPCMHPLPSAAAIGPSAVQHGIDTRISVCGAKLHFATTCPPHPLPLDAGFAVNLLFLLVASPDSNQGRAGDFRLLHRACVAPGFAQYSAWYYLLSCKPPQAVMGVCK
jgi:hypothetical protein